MTRSGRPPVYFHIGAPKTGTTFLQYVLSKNRARLRADGVLYPGTALSHFWASQDLRESAFGGHPDPHVPGSWDRLVREIRSWSGPAVIDHESFGKARSEVIDRALGDLDFAEVHIVYTARDLARQIPAIWQERIKNRSTQTYAEFLAAVQAGRRDGGPSGRYFWATYGMPRLLARWSRGLPADRVHIVTVPPPGSEPLLLWRRFAELIGIDPAAYDTDVERSNTSLGAAEAAVLRRFNEAIAELDVPWPAYAAVFKQWLAPTLSTRPGDRIELPQAIFDWVVDWSQEAVAELSAAGYDVVGDLAELVPDTRPEGTNPDEVPAEDRADAAVAGMVGLASIVMESSVAEAAVRRAQRGFLTRQLEEMSRRSRMLGRLRELWRQRRGVPPADRAPLPVGESARHW
ncbi:MAG TPA: hypothetical protein VFH38_06530 [Jatrophihabitans sp.]|nr:hypothetical protein [Jatrophihabitans sp.]